MVSPFDCVAAQDMGMADAERKIVGWAKALLRRAHHLDSDAN
jgi:hypothetical protein